MWGAPRARRGGFPERLAGKEALGHCVACPQTARSLDRPSQNLLDLLCEGSGEEMRPWPGGRNAAPRPRAEDAGL